MLSGHRFFALRTPILCYPDTDSYPDILSKIYENLSCRCPDSKESTKNFVDFGESVRTAVGVRRAKNLRKFRRFFFWLTDNSLGQWHIFGTIIIVWDKTNCMEMWQLLGTMTIIFDNDYLVITNIIEIKSGCFSTPHHPDNWIIRDL